MGSPPAQSDNLMATDIGGCQVTHAHGLGTPVKETDMLPGLSNVTNSKPIEADGSFSSHL